MVETVLRLRWRQYMDANVYGPVLWLREWQLSFQVSGRSRNSSSRSSTKSKTIAAQNLAREITGGGVKIPWRGFLQWVWPVNDNNNNNNNSSGLWAQTLPHSINNLHKKRPEKLQWPAKCQCAQFWYSFYVYPVKKKCRKGIYYNGNMFKYKL